MILINWFLPVALQIGIKIPVSNLYYKKMNMKDETFPDFSGIPDFLIAAYIFRKYQSPIISY